MVDSFKFLPRSLAAYYQQIEVKREEPVPFTPLRKPLRECRFALVTTAGVYVKGLEPPFDVEREKREPTWGDPSFRRIPRDVRQADISVSHLHYNTSDVLEDFNIVLPISRFRELEREGAIGSLASTHYSFMGFQTDTREWQEVYGPQVASLMKGEAVDCVFLTPA